MAKQFTTSLRYVTASLYVSIFSVVSTLIAPVLLVMVPQGRELLDMVADEQVLGFWKHWTALLHYVLFLCALLAWGFANWYGSRVLLQHDFINPLPAGSAGHRFIAAWNEWQPRVLGILGMTVIAGYILLYRRQVWAGGIAAVVVLLFALFIIHRRTIFKLPSAAEASRKQLLKGDRIAIWLGFACSFVIFVALAEVNYSFARTLGAPVILFTALASIVLVTSVALAYLPLSHGWPNLARTPFVLAFFLATTPLTRNHGVTPRLIESEGRRSGPRPSVEKDFRAWIGTRDQGGPIYIVAAEGGASRSAWWTAHVLATLDYASDGKFSRHVYAISGVSGGSLGAAAFVGLLAERGDSKPTFSKPLDFPDLGHCWDMRQNRDAYPTPMQTECFLGEDFLSTTLGYLLYPDLLQRIVPIPIHSWDRSLGLEQTWQNDWAHLFGARKVSEDPPRAVGQFGETLDALYQLDSTHTPRNDIPLLFLNTTRARTGRSALQSPVSIRSTELDDVFDARLRTRGMSLSTVVHNSARFPLVSPGGEVETWTGDYWDALVDGGYFENSGAATLAELVRALQGDESLAASLARIRVIFIMNDPAGGAPLFTPAPDRPAEPITHEELMTPLLGLYNTRTARADSARRELMSLLQNDRSKLTEIFLSPGIKAIRETDGHEKDPDPSMNWHLNPSSRRAMWAAVGERSTHGALCKVVQSVGSDCFRLQELKPIPAQSNR